MDEQTLKVQRLSQRLYVTNEIWDDNSEFLNAVRQHVECEMSKQLDADLLGSRGQVERDKQKIHDAQLTSELKQFCNQGSKT